MRNAPHIPSHIVLVGPMGAGKSSIGPLLAARSQRGFVDLDACIEDDASMSINQIFATEGETGFRSRECRALTGLLAMAEASVIASGGGAVLDEVNRRAMRHASTVVYLQVDPSEQLQRLQRDCTRPLLATDNSARRLAELQVLREPLYREVADQIFDTTRHSPESAADALAGLLAKAPERDS